MLQFLWHEHSEYTERARRRGAASGLSERDPDTFIHQARGRVFEPQVGRQHAQQHERCMGQRQERLRIEAGKGEGGPLGPRLVAPLQCCMPARPVQRAAWYPRAYPPIPTEVLRCLAVLLLGCVVVALPAVASCYAASGWQSGICGYAGCAGRCGCRRRGPIALQSCWPR